MSTARVRLSKKTSKLSDDIHKYFTQGTRTPMEILIMSNSEVNALWAEHGSRIVADYAERYPGKRPAAWWSREAPEKRCVVGGRGILASAVTNIVSMTHFGIQCTWVEGTIGEGDDEPRCESQAAFLQRHALFLPGEEKRLSAKDYESERLNDILGDTPEIVPASRIRRQI